MKRQHRVTNLARYRLFSKFLFKKRKTASFNLKSCRLLVLYAHQNLLCENKIMAHTQVVILPTLYHKEGYNPLTHRDFCQKRITGHFGDFLNVFEPNYL